MYQTDKCVVAQVLKVVDHSRMIQAFRFIEISKYDDGGQLTTHGQLMQGSSNIMNFEMHLINWLVQQLNDLNSECTETQLVEGFQHLMTCGHHQ